MEDKLPSPLSQPRKLGIDIWASGFCLWATGYDVQDLLTGLNDLFFCFCLGPPPAVLEGLLLALISVISHGRLRGGPYGGLGMDPRSITCKTDTLPILLWFRPPWVQ